MASPVRCMSATCGSSLRPPTTLPTTRPRRRFSITGPWAWKNSSTSLWPVLIVGTAWLVRRARHRRSADAIRSKRPYLVVLVLVTVVSFAVSLAVTYKWPPAAYFSLPTRAWQLAIGGLLSFTVGQWRRLPARPAVITGWAGLALILLACNQFTPATPYPGTAALLPVLGTALVIGAGCALPAQGVGRVLALPPMRAVGRVSYSWYLWHWPVLVLAAPLLGHPLGLAGRLATVVISGGLAVLTLRFIENPLRFAPSLRGSAARSLALGGAATAVAACVGVALLVWMPLPVGRGPVAPALTLTAEPPPTGSNIDAYDAAVKHAFAQVQTAVAASVEVKAVPSNLNPPLADVAHEESAHGEERLHAHLFPSRTAGVRHGRHRISDDGSPDRRLDAAMWSPAFEHVAAQRHWRLEALAKMGCPVLNLRLIEPPPTARVHRVRAVECTDHRPVKGRTPAAGRA